MGNVLLFSELELRYLAEALEAVGVRLPPEDYQQLIDFLKWPTNVGNVRAALMGGLEERPDQKFDRDLWKVVAWAEKNALDVKTPPHRPSDP